MNYFKNNFPSVGEEGWIYCTDHQITEHKMSELPQKQRGDVFGDCTMLEAAREDAERILGVDLGDYRREDGSYRFSLGEADDSDVFAHYSDMQELFEIEGVSFEELSTWHGYISYDCDVYPDGVIFYVGEDYDSAQYEEITDGSLLAKLEDFVASMRLVGLETTPINDMIEREWRSDKYPGWRATASMYREEHWCRYTIEGVEA